MKRAHFVFFPVALVYLVAVGIELQRVRYQINPDGISYLAIAERYLSGDFVGAVNAYWGPLFSWLLVPLRALRVEPLRACKILTFTVGLATLFGGWILSERYTRLVAIRVALTVALVPMILVWAGSLVTPDILVVCFLTYYAYFISDPAWSRRSLLLAGLCGALGYLSKSYVFVFFPIHFVAVALVRWFEAKDDPRRGRIVSGATLGMAVFLAVALPWITAISFKEGWLTFGSAGSYNAGLAGLTKAAPGGSNHAIHSPGLLAPPDGAMNAWENPSVIRYSEWRSPGESARHLGELVKRNSGELFWFLQQISVLAWLIVGASVLFIGVRWQTSAEARLVAATIASGALFAGGYVLIWVEPRYLWILGIMLLMLAGTLIDQFVRARQLSGLMTGIIAAVMAASFIVAPLALLPRLTGADRESTQAVKSLVYQGVDLRGRCLASDARWAHTLYVGYFTKARYFGVVRPNESTAVRRELDEFGIDTFFVWGDRGVAERYLTGFHQVPLNSRDIPFAVFER